MTAGNVVTLASGEAVSSCDQRWRDECFTRWQRMVAMRGMSVEARRQLLAQVQADEGDLARQRLEDEFRSDWNARKGAPHATARR